MSSRADLLTVGTVVRHRDRQDHAIGVVVQIRLPYPDYLCTFGPWSQWSYRESLVRALPSFGGPVDVPPR